MQYDSGEQPKLVCGGTEPSSGNNKTKALKSVRRAVPMLIAAIMSVCAVSASSVPAAIAAGSSVGAASERSFPSSTVARNNLFGESTATEIEEDSDWGGIETLDVPKTKTQSEKDTETEQEQQTTSQREAASDTATSDSTTSSTAASRSATRTALPEAPSSKNGSAIAEYATQFQGYPYASGGNTPNGWDCSGFVQYVFSQFGISLPHSSGAQATMGVEVAGLSQAQPGDIIANSTHAAIYIGNGMVMNAMNPTQGTGISTLGVFFGSYQIRRILQ